MGIDFDNTLVAYDEVLREEALRQGWIDGDLPAGKEEIRDRIRQMPDGEIKWRRLQGIVYGSRMDKARLAEGARDFLALCKKQGIKVFVISHKTVYPAEGKRVNLREVALDWMRKERFFSPEGLGLSPQDVSFHATRLEKIHRIQEMGCTHFVDDLEETFLEKAFPSHVRKFLYAPGRKQTALSGVHWVQGWDQMAALLFEFDARSQQLRRVIVKTMEAGGRGHFASAFSLMEILRVLYDDVLRYDPKNPRWPLRDRCILSKGHGCLALYAILADKGFFPTEELWKFCKKDGILGGHPEHKVPGVEASTGSLGHGLSIGVGFALHARHERSSHRVFVVIGDGESDEGSIWEAALCASKHKLSNLTVLVDYNKQQSYGSTSEVLDLEPFSEKWRAFGFAVEEVDGHDVMALRSALARLPFDREKPSAVICHTVKGKGIAFVENNSQWHHKSSVTGEEAQALMSALEV